MIVPMKKAAIAVLSADAAEVVYSLQRLGQFMPTDEEGCREVKTGQTPSLYEEADGALSAYGKYRQKKGLLSAPAEYTQEQFEQQTEQQKLSVIKAIELSEQLDSVNAQIKRVNESKKALIPYLPLGLDASDAADTRYTRFIFGRVPYLPGTKKPQALDDICAEAGLTPTVFNDISGMRYFYLFVFRTEAGDILTSLAAAGFEPLVPPYRTGTAKDEDRRLSDKLSKLEYTRAQLDNSLSRESENADSVELFYDQEKAKADRSEIPAVSTRSTVVMTGWVRSDKTQSVEAAVANATDTYNIEFSDPAEGEIPPTATKDNKFVSQYTAITNAFSVPGQNDVDPNPYMAPWYFLLYGMMVADVGYGGIMAISIYLFKKFKKPRGDTLKLVNLIWYSSITSVLFGVLYGSYFGSQLLPPLWMNPQEGSNIMTAMLFCIIIGALHIFTGMTINAVESIKHGRVADAICDQFSWMLLIIGIGMMFVAPLKTVGMVLAVAMAALILFTGGRKKKGIIGKVTGGVLALYNITGFLSDLLSYTRIFALSLSTGIIGMVMNLLGGMILHGIHIPVLNVLAAMVVYLFGHALNFALGLLGAYVHTSRLQYIEFFNKFYEGGGVPFKPLKINTKYTVIKNQD